jgi:hypothetical protein
MMFRSPRSLLLPSSTGIIPGWSGVWIMGFLIWGYVFMVRWVINGYTTDY